MRNREVHKQQYTLELKYYYIKMLVNGAGASAGAGGPVVLNVERCGTSAGPGGPALAAQH